MGLKKAISGSWDSWAVFIYLAVCLSGVGFYVPMFHITQLWGRFHLQQIFGLVMWDQSPKRDIYRPLLVGGFNPSENISQMGWLFPIYGKIKHVPNHQPACLLVGYNIAPDNFTKLRWAGPTGAWVPNFDPFRHFLRVIPSLTHNSDIASDVPSGSIYWIYKSFIYIYICMHSICHSRWHSKYLAFFPAFYLAYFWHLFSHSIYLTFSLTWALRTSTANTRSQSARTPEIWSSRLRSGTGGGDSNSDKF